MAASPTTKTTPGGSFASPMHDQSATRVMTTNDAPCISTFDISIIGVGEGEGGNIRTVLPPVWIDRATALPEVSLSFVRVGGRSGQSNATNLGVRVDASGSCAGLLRCLC